MNCLRCGKPMTLGSAQIRGTAWGFFIVGWSYQNLYSREKRTDQDNEPSEIRILRSRHSTDASRCAECGLVLLSEEKPD